MSRGNRIRRASEPTTTTNLSGLWTLNEIHNYNLRNKWPRGPEAPTNLSATPRNSQLVLSWNAPATTHGSITNYLVEYTGSDGSAQYVLTNSTSTNYTLTGLINGTSYSVRVAAVNFKSGTFTSTINSIPAMIVDPLYLSNGFLGTLTINPLSSVEMPPKTSISNGFLGTLTINPLSSVEMPPKT
ncbi:fibronectin type III domain-containing protein, partial [bacterium]|nr:fibronectin type III domain-containing protein [bacterium]